MPPGPPWRARTHTHTLARAHADHHHRQRLRGTPLVPRPGAKSMDADAKCLVRSVRSVPYRTRGRRNHAETAPAGHFRLCGFVLRHDAREASAGGQQAQVPGQLNPPVLATWACWSECAKGLGDRTMQAWPRVVNRSRSRPVRRWVLAPCRCSPLLLLVPPQYPIQPGGRRGGRFSR